jgi:carbonic anhydrase/acetyltransferase-like protein (isoleucine patch superfamily)
VIHGCRIDDYVLVGISVTVLSGSEVEGQPIIGAGTVVREDANISSY